jgi:hypothetical protein
MIMLVYLSTPKLEYFAAPLLKKTYSEDATLAGKPCYLLHHAANTVDPSKSKPSEKHNLA